MEESTVPVKPETSSGKLSEEKGEISPEYHHARKRVLHLKAFYLHLMVYVAVNALLVVIDMLTGPPFWFYWALMGWGIGLAVHAAIFWGMPRVKEWEEKMLKRELSRSNH